MRKTGVPSGILRQEKTATILPCVQKEILIKHLLPREALLRKCYAEQEAEGNKSYRKQIKTHNKALLVPR